MLWSCLLCHDVEVELYWGRNLLGTKSPGTVSGCQWQHQIQDTWGKKYTTKSAATYYLMNTFILGNSNPHVYICTLVYFLGTNLLIKDIMVCVYVIDGEFVPKRYLNQDQTFQAI